MTLTLADFATAADVLLAARESRVRLMAEEALQLRLACEWADSHPADSLDDAACFSDSPVAVAGPGAPLVAEFAVAEFAAALGMPTESGKLFLGEALELRHRLPRVWARVLAGALQGWRARRIARATIGLSPEAAAYVDRQISHVAHRVGATATDRLVDAAIAECMPELAAQAHQAAAERVHFTVDHRQVSFEGTTRVYGELDLSDALDLDAAVTARAQHLAELGSDASTDARRARAIAEIARHDLTLDLETVEPAVTRETVLHVHVQHDGAAAMVDETRSLVTADQVREWCASPYTRVTVKPVIDLDAHTYSAGYQVPDRLAEQVDLRDGTCAFPWCSKRAARCDHDHVVPQGAGGPTCSCNLAPLCRRHHRLKTHGDWTYTVVDPGTFLWSSPHGYQFLRDPVGTRDVSRDRRSGASPPPG